MPTVEELSTLARKTADVLASHRAMLVLAESCTGGLVAATLATVPGISKWLCGSAVVYQVETKAEWLGIPRALLDDPGPVSTEVAEAMARGVLIRTPQAQIAASVTGHLGPDAPLGQDGLAYLAVAIRSAPSAPTGTDMPVVVREHRLEGPTAGGKPTPRDSLRIRRQREAASRVLSLVCTVLEDGVGRHAVVP